MKYSLAFLIVAASAILVASMHPSGEGSSDGVPDPNGYFRVQQNHNKLIDELIAGSSNNGRSVADIVNAIKRNRRSANLPAPDELIDELIEALERVQPKRSQAELVTIKELLQMFFGPRNKILMIWLIHAEICEKNVDYSDEQVAMKIHGATPEELSSVMIGISLLK